MKVRFGMLMTDAVGKAGGQFIQRTRFGNVLRNITVPVQRLASLQNPQRGVNGFIFSYWSRLSDVQRALWVVIGSNLRTKNPYGEDVVMSGRDAFTSCSSLVFPYSANLADPAYFSYVRPVNDFYNVIVDSTSREIIFEANEYLFQDFFQIKGGVLKNGSVNLNLKKLKTFARVATITDSDVIFTSFTDIIGTTYAGDWVQLAIRGISSSGLASEWKIFKVRVQ